jgi:hypothetical protein
VIIKIQYGKVEALGNRQHFKQQVEDDFFKGHTFPFDRLL